MKRHLVILLAVAQCALPSAHAQSVPSPLILPGSADPARLDQRLPSTLTPPQLDAPQQLKPVIPDLAPPEGSKDIVINLISVRIEGMSKFTEKDMADIYQPYVSHRVTVDMAWVIAAEVTKRYQDQGYFLTRAYVPEQDITDGKLTIRVIEGYIGEVALDPAAETGMASYIVDMWVERLKAYRPVKASDLESVLLQLNDIPGISLQAVLEPLGRGDKLDDGAVKLSLLPRPPAGPQTQIGFDNYGSRFIGPYEATLQSQFVLLPNQTTNISLLASTPWDEVKYGSIRQDIPLLPALNLELSGNYAKSYPGGKLEPQELDSRSTQLGAGFAYKAIRQRDENLTLRLGADERVTIVDILKTVPLTRDKVRAARLSADYQTVDKWNGYDALLATISQGLGTPADSDRYFSRTEADPYFTKLELSGSRAQALSDDWTVVTASSLQVSSQPLFSAEEFGYGGQSFGRAFDNSELLGDNGINASLELRYTAFDPVYGFRFVPYTFYDAGIVWNYDQEQVPRAFGSSAGLGLRLYSDTGFSSNLGLAFPIAREIADPVYGNGKSPRISLQANYGF